LSSYRIRTAILQDLEAVYTVFAEADTLHRQAHPEIFREAENPAGMRQYLLDCILDDQSAILVAEEEGQVIAALNACVRPSADIPLLVRRNYVSIENVVVLDSHRRRGVGQALMERAEQWAQERNIDSIYLTVWEFNQDAIEFYERLGYEMLHHRMRKELP